MAAPRFIPAATSLDPNAGLDTSNFKRQMALAALLTQDAPGGVKSVPEGIGRMLAQGVGGYMEGKALSDEKASQSEANALQAKAWGAMLGGSDSIPTTGVSTPQAGAGGASNYADAISSIESGGRYDAVGPTHPKLGRALGKYQVMEANVGPWSQAALGRTVTADEFLANPQIQDQIFNAKFGEYVQKFGNPQDAASAWFTGRPRNAQSMAARDSLGTTGAAYVEKFNRALGQRADMPAPGATPATMPGEQGFDIPAGAPIPPNFDQTFARDETMRRLMQRRSPELASGMAGMAQGMNAPQPQADPNIPPPDMPGPLPPELMPPAVAQQPAPQPPMPQQAANVPLPPSRPADLPAAGGQPTQGPQPPMPGYTPGMLAPNQQGGDGQPYLAPFQTPQAPTPQMLAQGLMMGGPEGQMSGGQPPAPQQDRRQLLAQVLANPRIPPQMKAVMLQQFQQQNTPQLGELAPGASLYDKRTGRITMTAPAKPAEAPPAVREYEYAKSQGFQGSLQDYVKSKASSTNVNVNGGGSDKQIFDAMTESATTARSAATGLQSLREARRAVEGGAILGAGADVRLGLQKLGAALGIADPEKIVNTETFRAAIAPQVAALMKATVGSTQISNADREFAEKAAGGSISLDQGTITRLLGIMEKAGTAAIEGHKSRLEKIYPDANSRERVLFDVPMPAAPEAAPQAQPQGGTAKPANKAEYDALPSGTMFVAPDGTTRRKP